MTRPEFEHEIARLRGRIAALPADQRGPLEALARETVERHERIVRAAHAGERAAARLAQAWERLRDACVRLAALAAAARARRAPAQPGLN